MMLIISMCANGGLEFDVQELPLDSFNIKNTTKSSENCSIHLYNFTMPDYPSNVSSFGLWVDANIPFNSINNNTINNNQLDYIINSFYRDKIRNTNKSVLPNNNLKLNIYMTLHLSDTSDSEQNCVNFDSNAFYFYPNQAFFIHVTPSITSFLTKCKIELDLRSEQLPINLDTNQVGLGIYVNLPTRYEGNQVYSCK
jgi:hypothetical protein